MRRTNSLSHIAVVAAALAISTTARAQQSTTGTPAPGSAAFAPNAGQMAPDFSLPGASRYGLLKDPVKLSDFRGQTVVLAFFPKARTKG
jgi:peroxiredoxin Q/BCP